MKNAARDLQTQFAIMRVDTVMVKKAMIAALQQQMCGNLNATVIGEYQTVYRYRLKEVTKPPSNR
jgi:hypothetical protein